MEWLAEITQHVMRGGRTLTQDIKESRVLATDPLNAGVCVSYGMWVQRPACEKLGGVLFFSKGV